MFLLCYRERYSKPKWGNTVAEECKLTDKDIEGFVRGIQPVILNAMYSNSLSTTIPLQNLATLSPEIVIPPLIERLYGAFDTLTEPHKLTASMNAVVAVARSLVSSHILGDTRGIMRHHNWSLRSGLLAFYLFIDYY